MKKNYCNNSNVCKLNKQKHPNENLGGGVFGFIHFVLSVVEMVTSFFNYCLFYPWHLNTFNLFNIHCLEFCHFLSTC